MRDPLTTSVSGVHAVREGRLARTLAGITEHSRVGPVVLRQELLAGDQAIVRTRNSVYSLWSLGDDQFVVSGGWFDQQGSAPVPMTVNGCTYGGSVIRRDVIAAPGLFLEFGNNVLTTRIQEVRIVRAVPESKEQPS